MIPGPHVIAAKQMRIMVASQREMTVASAKRESRLLERAEHQNVIRLLGSVFDDPHYVYLLMELAEGGSCVLCSMQRGAKRSSKSLAEVSRSDWRTCMGLTRPSCTTTHERQRAARAQQQMAAAAQDCRLWLSNGRQHVYDEIRRPQLRNNAGTQAAKAPECFNNEFTTKSDDAFAIIAWELLTADMPWKNLSDAPLCQPVPPTVAPCHTRTMPTEALLSLV